MGGGDFARARDFGRLGRISKGEDGGGSSFVDEVHTAGPLLLILRVDPVAGMGGEPRSILGASHPAAEWYLSL
jgi:hypothetical protein